MSKHHHRGCVEVDDPSYYKAVPETLPAAGLSFPFCPVSTTNKIYVKYLLPTTSFYLDNTSCQTTMTLAGWQPSLNRSHDSRSCHKQYTIVQYESSITYRKKVMAKVKIQCQRRHGRRHQDYDINSPDISPGSLKNKNFQ